MRTGALILIGLLAGSVAGGNVRAQDKPVDNPEACRDLWTRIGLPAHANDDEDDVTTVCHLGYIVEHNNERKIPNWVVERLTREVVDGDNPRPKIKFKPEPAVSEGFQAQDKDYTNSDYARGHQAASADFKARAEWMRDTFFLSNAVPQSGDGFNSGVWARLEDLVQKLAIERSEIYVITGPVHQPRRAIRIDAESDACRTPITIAPLDQKKICTAVNEGAAEKCGAGVHVPAALFKIVFDPGRGRVNAYLMPNIDHRPLKRNIGELDYIKKYRVGVNSVEAVTGLRFFEALSARTRNRLRETCPATMLH